MYKKGPNRPYRQVRINGGLGGQFPRALRSKGAPHDYIHLL